MISPCAAGNSSSPSPTRSDIIFLVGKNGEYWKDTTPALLSRMSFWVRVLSDLDAAVALLIWYLCMVSALVIAFSPEMTA